MKFKSRIEVDTESGEYEVHFENVSNPGENMDYYELREHLAKVFTDWGQSIEEDDDSSDQVIKSIH